MFKFFYSKKGFTLTELLICVIILSILAGVGVPIFDKKQKTQKMNDCIKNCELMTTAIQEMMTGMMDNGKKQAFYVNRNHDTYGSSAYLCNYVINWVFVTENGKKADNARFADKARMIIPIASKGKSVWAGARKADYDRAQSHIFRSTTYPHSTYNWNDYKVKLYSIYGGRMNKNFDEVFMYAIYKKTESNGTIDNSGCCTLGDIRGGYRNDASKSYNEGCKDGSYLKKEALAATPVYVYFANEEVPTCPFDKKNEYSYFILIDGTVVCNCPTCIDYKYKVGYKDSPNS